MWVENKVLSQSFGSCSRVVGIYKPCINMHKVQGNKHSLSSMHFSPSTSYIGHPSYVDHPRSPIRFTAQKTRFHTNTWRTTSYETASQPSLFDFTIKESRNDNHQRPIQATLLQIILSCAIVDRSSTNISLRRCTPGQCARAVNEVGLRGRRNTQYTQAGHGIGERGCPFALVSHEALELLAHSR